MKHYKRRIYLIIVILFIIHSVYAQVNLPYTTNFESGSTGWTTFSADTVTRWQLGLPTTLFTNTTHSGTNCWDINLSTQYGNNAVSTLQSPVFNLGNNDSYLLSFWLNRYTNSYPDGMRIEFSTDQINWSVLGTYKDPKGLNWYNDSALVGGFPGWTGISSWKKHSYFIKGYSNQQLSFRFVFTSDASGTSYGISMDDFSFTEAPVDLEANFITNWPFLNGQPTDSIGVRIINRGDDVNNFTVSYTYNSITQSINHTDSLKLGDTLIVKLPGFVVQPSGTICATVNIPLDTNLTNNQYCYITEPTELFPVNYFNDFDSSITGWTVKTPGDSLTKWEWGAPAYHFTCYAFSGSKCWDTNLDASYFSNARTSLLSPYFDLSGAVNPYLSFRLNFRTNTSLDYLKVEYTINGDTSWYKLGQFNDPNGINWNNPGWQSYTDSWIYCQYKLPAQLTTGKIRFRFTFYSGQFGNSDGYSLDNFAINSSFAEDLITQDIIQPISTVHKPDNELRVKFRNQGQQTINGFPVTYSVNGQPPITINSSTIIAPGQAWVDILGTIQLTPGANIIKVWTTYGPDMWPGNDTATLRMDYTYIHSIPYTNHFDSAKTSWYWSGVTGSFNSPWEWGIPSFGATNSVYSPPGCWDLALNTAYNPGYESVLITELFNIKGHNNELVLEFKINYDLDPGLEGVYLLYVDSTQGIWNKIIPLASENWSNVPVTVGSNQIMMWSGNSNGWKKVRAVLNNLSQDTVIKFQFVFAGNGVTTYSGFSIDDFSVYKRCATDISVLSILDPANEISTTSPQRTKIEVVNTGTTPVTGFLAHYAIDNVTAATVSWTGNLAPNTITTINFPVRYISAGNHELKAWVTMPQDSVAENDTLIKRIHSSFVSAPISIDPNTGTGSQQTARTQTLPLQENVTQHLTHDTENRNSATTIEFLAEVADFQLQPNPVKNNMLLTQLPAGRKTIKILDESGRIVSVGECYSATTVLECASIANGIYFLTIESDSGTSLRKTFVKN